MPVYATDIGVIYNMRDTRNCVAQETEKLKYPEYTIGYFNLYKHLYKYVVVIHNTFDTVGMC